MRALTGPLVAALVSAAILTGCGGGNTGLSSSPPTSAAPQIGAPLNPSSAGITAERTHVRRGYSVLYSFKGGTDGASPAASLLNVDSTLYGTTYSGGANKCFKHQGCGTVFAIRTSGETVLDRFKGKSGAEPVAALLEVNGTLYGTTKAGGAMNLCKSRFARGCGTVFSITPSGIETVLHTFGSSGDGAFPSGLIDVNGTLYGTTSGGGANGYGTVFAVTTSGTESVLYSFKGGKDGAYPAAGLLDVKGTLYGTTAYGGACSALDDCGTVFAVTTSGKERVLHSFSAEGGGPLAGLINVKGTLYGTTSGGGAYYDGMVFAITTSGKETVIYSFDEADGSYPEAALLNVKGTLYGTTSGGGANGLGTVFAITRSRAETVLYSFAGQPDGAQPTASLIDLNGALYGTTDEGGANDDGAIFSLSP